MQLHRGLLIVLMQRAAELFKAYFGSEPSVRKRRADRQFC